jgi:sulfhydrogenase subunit beta (sulfur reductase)
MTAKAWKITRAGLDTLTQRLLSRASVVAPTRTQAGEYDYDVVTAPEQVSWDYTISLSSLKRYFLPQTETLFSFAQKGGGVELKQHTDERPRIFLGVRCCDISALRYLEQGYQRDYPDPHFAARYQDILIIGLACPTSAAPTCFCVCGDGGPFLDEGFDLQLIPMAGEYLVEVGSEKGEKLVSENQDLFSAASEADIKERAVLKKKSETTFGDFKTYNAATTRKLSTGSTAPQVWEAMGEVCFGCGGCAFICPTCTCFTTCDKVEGEAGTRERHWDSCCFACYTREASGHNPRKDQAARLKARFFHKISYQFVLKNGRHACVGCGRCAYVCLGESSMPEVAEGVRRGEWR